MHYARWNRARKGAVDRRSPIDVRFWRHVAHGEGLDCWPWSGYRNDDGYGQVRVDGKVRGAHRVAWEILRGEIPDGLELDHLCRNRACVNPWHLDPVTKRVNWERGAIGALSRGDHCRRGHEFTQENTSWHRDGGQLRRRCRTCNHRPYDPEARRARYLKELAESE